VSGLGPDATVGMEYKTKRPPIEIGPDPSKLSSSKKSVQTSECSFSFKMGSKALDELTLGGSDLTRFTGHSLPHLLHRWVKAGV